MSTEFTPIETERLILRRFQESDLRYFHAYRSDPEIEKYQGWGEFTIEDARKFIANQGKADLGAPGAHVQIAIELRSTGEMIGDVYVFTPEDEPDQARLGYSIATAHQRRGYAMRR
jgi:aminoglycoside 6'-N-acetyltransferase